MRTQASLPAERLPSRFPVGTRYVIEGRGGHVQSRYIEFPDGRRVKLQAESTSDLAGRPRSRGAGLRPRGRRG